MGGSISSRRRESSSLVKSPTSSTSNTGSLSSRGSRHRRSLRSFRRIGGHRDKLDGTSKDRLPRTNSTPSIGRPSISQDSNDTVNNPTPWLTNSVDLTSSSSSRRRGSFGKPQHQRLQSNGSSIEASKSAGYYSTSTDARECLRSPFTLISRDDVFGGNEDFQAVRSFLQQYYSSVCPRDPNLRLQIHRSISSPDNPLLSKSRFQSGHRVQRVLCEFESLSSAAKARDELRELSLIEEKLQALEEQDRRCQVDLNPTASPVFFILTPEDDSQIVSLATAARLLQERKEYLYKKIDLESSHSQGIRNILCNNSSSPPIAQESTMTAELQNHFTSTPYPSYQKSSSNRHSISGSSLTSVTPSSSFSRPRKPRALSLIESADGIVGLDSSSYRNLMQDVKDVKTLLFRLQGLLQEVSFIIH